MLLEINNSVRVRSKVHYLAEVFYSNNNELVKIYVFEEESLTAELQLG